MAASNSPEILLLSLSFQSFLDEIYSSLFDRLSESASLKRAKEAGPAIRYLQRSTPKAIIITDEGLTDQANAEVLQKVVSYVQNGGLAIIGLHFPSFTTMTAMNNLFASSFNLPWRRGDYHRTVFERNPSCVLPQDAKQTSLPGPCSMKCLHIKNARPHEKIFIPVSDAMTQSNVFPPEYVDKAQAAAAGAQIGKGYLAYCGDVNGEAGSNQIILTLCGFD